MSELEALSEVIIAGNAGKAKEVTARALANGVRATDVVTQGLLPGMSPAASPTGLDRVAVESQEAHSPRVTQPLRIKTLACEVLARQVYLAAARSPHVVDVDLLEKGLHDDAGVLRRELQRRIDAVPTPPYDAVVLVYGLCNRATEGLVARDVPLVMARAHDCITLYLGSREQYSAQFEQHPGTFYYSAEYLERGKNGRPALAEAGGGSQDDGMAYNSRPPAQFEALVRKYGEENARYLMEVYGNWHQHYTRAAYISLPCVRCEVGAGCEHSAPYRQRAQHMATKHGWQYVELHGSATLVDRLLNGDWTLATPADLTPDQADILVVPPGLGILATFDDRVVIAAAGGDHNARGEGP